MTLVKKQVGQRIRESREAAGLSQVQLAQRIGELDSNKVSRWERGQNMPGTLQLARIAEVCREDMLWMVLGRTPEDHSMGRWLAETALGREAAGDPEAMRFLRRIRLGGYKADLTFWDFAYQGYKHGLEPEAAEGAAKLTRSALD